jgi:hypothetical protein
MKTITNGAQFIDQNCKISLQGKTFTSGGAFIARNTKTKKLRLNMDSGELREQ